VPKGHVITTDPGPGARVLDHGTITLTVSEGKERYAVPTLHGKTVNQAQDALLATHLAYGRSVMRWSEQVPKGRVIASTPVAGKREPRDTAVDLVVSRGPAPIRVHDWSGQDAARATRVMQAQGLKVDASNLEFSDSVPEGAVISQHPTSGVLHRGDLVQLVVSKGPQLVQIPGDLRAQGVDSATAELVGLGFKVKVVHARYYIGVGYVYSSDPSPGSMAPKGSTVTLHII
jgi:serine/threonine-protein kinase